MQTPAVQDRLCRRKDLDELQLLNGPLAEHIKASYRLDLIAPEFDTDRIFLGEIKNIENISSHSKLPSTLDLVVFFISHADETFCQIRQIQSVPFSDPQSVLSQDTGGDLRCQKRRKSGDHSHRFPFRYAPKTLQALLVDLIATQVSLIKDQVSCRENSDISVIKSTVLGNLLCPQVTVGEHQAKTCALTGLLLPAQ